MTYTNPAVTRSQPLPPPAADAAAHSQQVFTAIKREIAAHGPMSFARYMELVLYAPGLGYYSAGAHKFGAAGDFVTAPEISPLFSRCVAKQCQQILEFLHGGDIIELGAGSGVMAADILLELERLNALPDHYYILEISADLKQRQQQLLKQKIPHLMSRIVWLTTLSELQIKGVVLANEVLDALPVHKFKIENNNIEEFYVDIVADQLVWNLQLPKSDKLINQINALAISADAAYESEINLLIPSWVQSISDCLQQGLVLFIDYGYGRREYYLPERNQGTLRCHYRHYAHNNPLLYPGLQDITAHVDFTAVAEAGEQANLTVAGYVSQSNFLLNCGITELAQEQVENFEQQYQTSQQLKRLLFPTEMGEIFKAMALSRHCNIPLLGFKEYDSHAAL